MLSSTKRIIKVRPKAKIFGIETLIFFGPLYSLLLIRETNQIQLRLHLGADTYITPPKGIIVRVFKRRLVLFGNLHILKPFVLNLMNMRLPNIFTGTGLRNRSLGYKTKPGKIRRR